MRWSVLGSVLGSVATGGQPLAQHFPTALFFPRSVWSDCHAITATHAATNARTRACCSQRGIGQKSLTTSSFTSGFDCGEIVWPSANVSGGAYAAPNSAAASFTGFR
jgi:hypothetical protein